MDGLSGVVSLIPPDARERTARAFKGTIRPARPAARITRGLTAGHAALLAAQRQDAQDYDGGQDQEDTYPDLGSRVSRLESMTHTHDGDQDGDSDGTP